MKKNNKKIYFMGIKGVGVASLAIIAKQAGFCVNGSDIADEFITDAILKKEGIKWKTGFSEKNVMDFAGNDSSVTVVFTSAHGGYNNPEIQYAINKGYKILTHGQAAGAFMDGKILGRSDLEGISIAGTHGKTTITAMIASYLQKLGYDPSYTVGTSEIIKIGSSGHFGKGKYFVAEADEYVSDLNYDKKSKFLYQYPNVAIINNIDFDHPDFFNNLEDVEEAFSLFTDNIKENGTLILNGDDEKLNKIKAHASHIKNIFTCGLNPSNDYYISKYHQDEFNSYFSVASKNIYLGNFKLSVPGFHNARNALSVIVLLLEIGVSVESIKTVLPFFLGTKRRIEYLGTTKNGANIIDDYAHHPREIRASLSAIKNIFPKKKIVCIFQPHTYSRTKALFKEFVSAFADSDYLVLFPIYASLRENSMQKNLSDELFYEINKIKQNVSFFKESNFVIEYINKNHNDNNHVIVTMGAGDVYKIAENIKNL